LDDKDKDGNLFEYSSSGDFDDDVLNEIDNEDDEDDEEDEDDEDGRVFDK
jgi:hypothetical protein